MVDKDFLVDMCNCRKCEACRQFELLSIDGGCECVYEEVKHESEDGYAYTERVLVTKCEYCKTLDAINERYDNYRLMEKANIDMELWDECKVIDGVIYTPQSEVEESHEIVTPYDEVQDMKIVNNTMASIENFEMSLILEDMIHELGGSSQVDTLMKTFSNARSAIGDSYVSMILIGKRTFDSVPERLKQEVATKLIKQGRADLVTNEKYLPIKE